ncbi:hypothetical protein BVG19_g2965 [[Candida] boidinii]|nr:hypothetical protein BVG19_g2965 [[Candida] boidinii]OWB50428.1 hypothetical protein B5S27_g1978 [[Candida] boidinii]OWB66614.1 hypothetical protein B5S30_g1956 [[Candida] boidinii]OWB83889.1 hypothetical protein B5S33_g2524 [[Candida] boidinii]GMG17815.1 unnamed protein product [[Candida] boidinii]
MSLWADKHRPKNLKDLDYHDDVSDRLRALASSKDFPHLLIYGPSGAGKKTRVLSTLKELYGSGAERLKVDVRTFTTPSNRKLEFNLVSSPYHLEITPSDMGNNDRVVIQDLLKEVGQVESIDFTSILNTSSSDGSDAKRRNNKFKTVIINEAEMLSRDAQAALRRTMEKYSATLRLILICNSTSSIIDPIKSRTLLVRVSSPSIQEMSKVFNKVIERETTEVKRSFPSSDSDREKIFNKISEVTNGNLRMGLLMLEAMYMNYEVVTTGTPIIVPDWEGVIKNLAKSVISDRTVANLNSTRTILYELIAHSIPSKLILKTLLWELWGLIEKPAYKVKDVNKIRSSIVDAAAVYDERLSIGNKDIFHLEGFITKIMVVLEKD